MERRIPFSKPPYAAFWKSSICRIQTANLTFRLLANLQFGEGLEQRSLSEHREDGVLRGVDQFFKIALHIGTHEAAMGNASARRPDFGIGDDRAVDVPQGDLGCWSCETHATGLAHLGPQEFALDSRTQTAVTEYSVKLTSSNPSDPKALAVSQSEPWQA